MMEIIERRKQERYKLKRDTYIYSALSFTFVGEAIDISRSGISFRYMEDGDLASEKIDELGILIPKFGRIEENFPFQIVSENALPDHSANNPVMRRCGGCFISLTPEQEGELEQYIARFKRREG